ncbi:MULTISPECIES: hypothetical protein [unclassified Polaribacter]|uniref:hypothetical protein n=1 Tax=unclassified Polaribacter TaxID=196858 RepID=UPI0011BFC1E7|nr:MULTISPECIES: hypothetical protein [unclassified Polaribacter]TXD52465.1 hypothetical protein ES043_08735 [Polaribacter sp. IC063]TXD61103.1 hypothetical protein ES044_06005 [Polaribacter sp. IC066]
MKNVVLVIFLSISLVSFSQKKLIKKFTSTLNEVLISTKGLDDFVLENATTNCIEIILFSENSHEQDILVAQKNNEIQIAFQLDEVQEKEIIFRKFMTERLQKANAIIRIPKGKKVIIFGDNVDIESKDFKNPLEIYIENGIVKLNTIKANILLKLYSGNVYATVKDSNINVLSKKGTIKVNTSVYQKEYKKVAVLATKKISITSLMANILLTTK